ncbi:MAG TPA: HAD family phosphatase [Bacteroidales bacterium]|nr:HAD family phosphatase [Bacteroidales bacterium]
METISSQDNTTGKNYIAFFDLDHTIISINSGKAFVKNAYKYGFMTGLHIITGLWLSILYKLNIKDPAKIIYTMVSWLKGVPEEQVKKLSSDVFRNYLLESIHPEILNEISYHKKNGARVVILSSSIQPLCLKVAEHLGIDDVICSDLEVNYGVYTGNTKGPICFGKEKIVRLKEYCNKNNINPIYSWYYGDDISDLLVLSSVGNPVCVNPDKKLRKAAYKKGWKILQWY